MPFAIEPDRAVVRLSPFLAKGLEPMRSFIHPVLALIGVVAAFTGGCSCGSASDNGSSNNGGGGAASSNDGGGGAASSNDGGGGSGGAGGGGGSGGAGGG